MRFATLLSAGLALSAVEAKPISLKGVAASFISEVKKETTSWNKYIQSHLPHLASKPQTFHRNNKWSKGVQNGKYLDWVTFKANGVNLGNWLLIEYSSNQEWWDSIVPSSDVPKDEWSFCEALGARCGPVMEAHYATYYTFADIDKLASVGVNLLRVPLTYQAFIDVPGSQLYHGNQLTFFKLVTDYAIERYGMHIVVDLHSLPGGCNGLDNGEALGHYYWWNNATNMEYSLQLVESAMHYIQGSGHPNAYSLSIINEAINNFTGIGTGNTVTTEGVQYMLGYLNKTLEITQKINPKVPIMWQDSWMGESFWSPLFPQNANIVIDVHIYFFLNTFSNAYSKYFTYSVCGAGDYFAGDKKFPVFVGEWSNEILYNNSLADRKTNFDTQRYAYSQWGSGSAFWSGKQYGNENVSGEGIRSDYWCYECMIDDGVITTATTESYC